MAKSRKKEPLQGQTTLLGGGTEQKDSAGAAKSAPAGSKNRGRAASSAKKNDSIKSKGETAKKNHAGKKAAKSARTKKPAAASTKKDQGRPDGAGKKRGARRASASKQDKNSSARTESKAKGRSRTKLGRSEIKKKRAEKQKMLLSSFEGIGETIYKDLDQGQFPKLNVPTRSVKNIIYDHDLRQYTLGNSSSVRSSRNTSQLRSFTQLMWLAFFANRLTHEKKSSTLRDVYYSSQAFAIDFKNQSESDGIIVDLEAVISRPREDFHIFPEERSAVFGDLNIEYTVPGYEGKRMNLANHPDGYAIGPSLTSAELVDTGAEIVIAIEKGGLFTRFVEEQVDKRFKAIIVDTGGQAPRSTRTLLRRLHDELSLPVIILTDGDVYGEHIAMVIKSGSANAAHLRELTVPDAKWVGVWASDIDRYKLPTIPMTDADIKRCHDLLKDPRYQEGLWKKELDVFLKIKKKAELEAFTKYGLTNITDKYLPAKLELAKTL